MSVESVAIRTAFLDGYGETAKKIRDLLAEWNDPAHRRALTRDDPSLAAWLESRTRDEAEADVPLEATAEGVVRAVLAAFELFGRPARGLG